MFKHLSCPFTSCCTLSPYQTHSRYTHTQPTRTDGSPPRANTIIKLTKPFSVRRDVMRMLFRQPRSRVLGAVSSPERDQQTDWKGPGCWKEAEKAHASGVAIGYRWRRKNHIPQPDEGENHRQRQKNGRSFKDTSARIIFCFEELPAYIIFRSGIHDTLKLTSRFATFAITEGYLVQTNVSQFATQSQFSYRTNFNQIWFLIIQATKARP